jgi:hypothetical protein
VDKKHRIIWAACLTFDNRVIRPADPSLIDQRFGTWMGQVDYKESVWNCEISLQFLRTRNIESAIRAFHFMFDKRVIKQANPSSIGQRFGSWQGRLPKTESTIEAAQELVWQARNQAGWPFINRSEIWDLSWMDELANGFDESRTRNIESAIWAACFMFDERVIKPADPSLIDQRFGTWVGQVDYKQGVGYCEILL